MNLSTHLGVAVYTVAGSSTARELPDWLRRKRARSSKKDPDYANRVELLQDFEFPGASSCVRASDDGNWLMSTGTYKPQIRVHHLPDLSLSYSRHTNALNLKFILLSRDVSKSLLLQNDRWLEFHGQGSLHHSLRIPRYGRDLIYNRRDAEALIPAAGVNGDGMGEVYRLNLELGRFMKSYEIDVGGDDMLTAGGGSLQGGIQVGSVNTAACAEESHNLLAFGTSIGTVEFWDSRCQASIGALRVPSSTMDNTVPQVTALEFNRGGMIIAAGDSSGMTYLYDLRSPVPIQKKDQGFGLPIKNLSFLESSASFRAKTADPMLLSADKRGIKIWNRETTKNWAWVEPAVDLNHVEWCKDSGMILTANEGSQQHAFFIPQLGPAPKWCSFLDNIVEEMAEDATDPRAYGNSMAGAAYDNYKFLTMSQLQTLNIDHLVGKTSLLRPYMHGYFVTQRLYEEARLITNPTLWEDERKKRIKQKIDDARESRIRGNKKVLVKQNRQLAEKIMEREERNERRKAKRALAHGGDEPLAQPPAEPKAERLTLLNDPRFSQLFDDEQFVIDEASRDFAEKNPVRKAGSILPKGKTAVEEEMEERDALNGHSSDESDALDSSDNNPPQARYQTKPNLKPRTQNRNEKRKTSEPELRVISRRSVNEFLHSHKSFGSQLAHVKPSSKKEHIFGSVNRGLEISFVPEKKSAPGRVTKSTKHDGKRRSASGNALRHL